MPKKILNYIGSHIDNVVWDWNGTLLNDLNVILECEAEHFVEYGIQPLSKEERNKIFCFPIKTFYERAGFDFSKVDFQEANDRFLQIYERALSQAPLFEGMAELLLEIQAQGKKQFVLSAAPQLHLEEVVRTHAIYDIFADVYGLPNNHADSKIGRGKELVAAHALDPERTLMIGDTPHDHEVGQALGFHVLLIADGHKPFADLVEIHDQVLETRYSR